MLNRIDTMKLRRTIRIRELPYWPAGFIMLICSIIGGYRPAARGHQDDQGDKCEQLFHNDCFQCKS